LVVFDSFFSFLVVFDIQCEQLRCMGVSKIWTYDLSALSEKRDIATSQDCLESGMLTALPSLTHLAGVSRIFSQLMLFRLPMFYLVHCYFSVYYTYCYMAVIIDAK